ncbi:MAG: aldo/keto reductase [Fibrobacter sp.]|nr:aldo/keto reductase [Fibrobacter sp.]
MKSIKLKSGYSIPILGLGTWLVTGRECFDAVLTALECGYTHIDTASAYENEDDIGKAIIESGIERSSLFLTTKIWYQKLRFNDVIEQCKQSLDKLRTDYIDLLLIHWPNKFIPLQETFDAFERLVEERKVRSIGVSNFTIPHLQEALKSTVLPIAANQIEFHPFFFQKEVLDFCNKNDIAVIAYSPLAHGKVFQSDILKSIANQKKCEPSQLALAWLMQKNIIVIPKASTEEHIKSNLESLSIVLNDTEIEQIDSIPRGNRIINPSWAEFS